MRNRTYILMAMSRGSGGADLPTDNADLTEYRKVMNWRKIDRAVVT